MQCILCEHFLALSGHSSGFAWDTTEVLLSMEQLSSPMFNFVLCLMVLHMEIILWVGPNFLDIPFRLGDPEFATDQCTDKERDRRTITAKILYRISSSCHGLS